MKFTLFSRILAFIVAAVSVIIPPIQGGYVMEFKNGWCIVRMRPELPDKLRNNPHTALHFEDVRRAEQKSACVQRP